MAGVLRTLIRERIAPTITRMQAALPLSMAKIIPSQDLSYHMQLAQFNCASFMASDEFFDSLNFK
jgi:hypothetical protein